MADARRKEAAARVASRWLSGLKSRRVRQPSRLRLTVWLTGESDSEAIAKALTSCGAESTRYNAALYPTRYIVTLRQHALCISHD